MTTRAPVARVRIRRGRLQDLAQVKEFTQDTFSWGDYLPGAWTGWIRSKRGILLVAESDAHVVGTCHLRLLEHREGWLEGLRVRHAFRKQGIAGLLIQSVHDHAAKNNCRVVRLETGRHNLAAQRVFEKIGYRLVAQYLTSSANAREGSSGRARLAKMSDAKRCWEMWQASSMRRATNGIVPAPYGWRWWELTRVRLDDEIRRGRVWMLPNAFMVIRTENGTFDITLLVGSKRDALKLLAAARAFAFREASKTADWLMPHTARITQWATDAGFALDEDMLIYACDL